MRQEVVGAVLRREWTVGFRLKHNSSARACIIAGVAFRKGVLPTCTEMHGDEIPGQVGRDACQRIACMNVGTNWMPSIAAIRKKLEI